MTRAIGRVATFARTTVREATRNKLLYNLLLFAALMIGSSIVLAQLHIGDRTRIYRDVGLSAIALFGALIAIFVGINLVNRELAQKTVYTLLAKPVHRWEFVVGKYLGLLALLALELAVMAAGFLGMLFWLGETVGAPLAWAIALTFAELALVTAVAIFFSSFTTPYLAGMLTVALWLAGHLLTDLRAFGVYSGVPALEATTEVLYWLLPNLDRVDIRAGAAGGQVPGATRLALSALYAALYSGLLLGLSTLLFRRRDFS